jgi:kynurenine formamidase
VRADPTEEDGAIAARGNWGRWGAEDERGTLNLMTPELVLEALRTPRTGRIYALGAPIGRDGVPVFGFRPGPLRTTLYDDRDAMGRSFGAPDGVGATEDLVSFPTHNATHIDALCHVHDGEVMYNGHPQSGMRPFGGAERCGVEVIGGFATRGVLVDLVAERGAPLDPGEVVTVEQIQEALDVELRAGDAVLLRTGWLEGVLGNAAGAEPGPQPGIGRDAARWLGSLDLAAVGADNMAVEAIPLPEGAMLGHVELLVNHGVHMMENLVLHELAADGCHEFLLVVSPLRVTGATGSPVNPIAIA